MKITLLEFFVAQVTARAASGLLGIQHNSSALFYHKIRLVIEYHLAQEAKELFDGEIELDESYFGGIRKGKRGRGAGGKTAVFGLLKRNGKVYTACVKDTKNKKHFHLFIKECEFRFNYGTPSQKLKTLRKWCGI